MPSVSKGFYKWLLWRGATLEDFADRLNHFWTFGLLLLLACIVSWKQSYNNPIDCWTPVQFTKAYNDYVNTLCWNSYFIMYPRDAVKAEKEIAGMFNVSSSSTSMYFVGRSPFDPFVSNNEIDETSPLLTQMSTTRTLYQWIPVILCIQALFFKLPNLLMYILHGYSGISFDKIAGLTSGSEKLNLTERAVLNQQIGRYIFNWCQQFRNWLPWRLLTLLWVIVKFLYCVNIIAQMCLIDSFLKTTDPPLDNSTSFGDVIIGNLFRNNASLWKESPAFPRNIFCDFEIVMLQNIQKYKVQCILPANYFNEYVYMFIWVWCLFVAIVTTLSLVIWLPKTLYPMFRKRYIAKAMALANNTTISAIQSQDISKFCDIVGEDGVMVLKLMAANSSEILVGDVVSNMWKMTTTESRPHGGGQIMSVPEVQVHSTAPTGPPETTSTIGADGQTIPLVTKKTE